MSQTLEKLSKISATLPEEMRESFERNVLSDAEVMAAEIRAESAGRCDDAMIGLREVERGEYLTMPEFRARLEALKADTLSA